MQAQKSIFFLAILVSLYFYFFWFFDMNAIPIEKIFSLTFFSLLLYLTGYSFTKGILFTKDNIELHVMRLGCGLAALPLVMVLFETFGISQHWVLYLLAGLIFPVYTLLKKSENKKKTRKKKKTSNNYTWHTSLSMLIASTVFCVALIGSFSYSYLENGDSWEHAIGVKYITMMQTYTKPKGVYVSHYLPPYPPTYDTLMALVHQLNLRLQWTLKAFNAIMLGLTILFAYYFVKQYSENKDIAIYTILFLAVAPGFGSHTIWSHTLGIAVLFPAFYFIVKRKEDPWFLNLSIFLLASSMITQPLVSMVIGIFYILYLVSHSSYTRKELKPLFILGVGALVLSLIYWIPSISNYGVELDNVDRVGGEILDLNFRFGFSDKDKPPDLMKIIFPKTHGDIYMQPGFGLFYSILMIIGVILILEKTWSDEKFLRKRPWLLTSFLWLIFTFIALESVSLPISIYPARFWGFLPIGGSIVASYAVLEIIRIAKKNKVNTLVVTAIIVFLILLTSGYYKVRVQAKPWPSDIGTHLDKDIRGYMVLKYMTPDTRVYPICLDDKFVVGMDKISDSWDPEVVEFRKNIIERKASELHSLLKKKRYEYTILESYCGKRCVKDLVKERPNLTKQETMQLRSQCISQFSVFIQDLMSYNGFEKIYSDNKTGIFKVKYE